MRSRRRRPPRWSHGLVCGRAAAPTHPFPARRPRPQTTPSDGRQCVCVRPRIATSSADRPSASYAGAAPLTLPPHRHVRSKHVPNAVRAQQHALQHPPQPSCAAPSSEPLRGRLVASSAAAAPTHPSHSRDLVGSDGLTAVPVVQGSRSPLPSLLRRRPYARKRRNPRPAAVSAPAPALAPTFSPLSRPRRHPPQPSARIFLPRR